jgi:predicted AAA+ superfamily ATPase
MIQRDLSHNLGAALANMPVVVVVGPRQVGKTTLAFQIAGSDVKKKTAYLDLELDSDLSKLDDPETYLRRFDNQLLIIDEVQRKPDLFRLLRGLVDARKRAGEKSSQFLLLGSASRDLLQQSSETLAGRIRYLELTPFTIMEIYKSDPLAFSIDKLWFRGGFPESYLAENNDESWSWRSDFLAAYIERDITGMGPNVSPTRMRRFLTMLAHYQGGQLNMSDLGKSLEVSHTTIKAYLDILTDFYMVRQVQPWSGNTKKRLVKSPKIYIRDSGILHRLLQISNFEDLMGNPLLGASWEGFVIENIINGLSDKWQHSYYRSASQSEIDLVLEGPHKQVWAIEIKGSVAPKLSKGYYTACEDIKATQKFVIYAGNEQYTMNENVEAIGVVEFLKKIQES